MTVASKFYQLGTATTNNSTTQFLELTAIPTDYAVLRFVFNGMIDHSGGGTTNVASGQWQQGVSIQFQGAWTGGPNASSARYRNMQGRCKATASNWEYMQGVTHGGGWATTDYCEMGDQFYNDQNFDDTERFTIEGICVQPGNNQSKQILWKGSGTSPAATTAGTNYSCSGWFAMTKLDAQDGNSGQRAMAPMDSIRIGAGWDSAGTPKTLGVYSNLTVFGEGWTSDVQTGNTP